MSKVRHLRETLDKLPEWFLDTLQEFISTYVSPNFALTLASSTSLQIVAAADNGLVAAALAKAGATVWRYNVATISAAAPGGLSVGDHDIYITAYANVFVNQAGPPTERDDTVHAFGLKLVAAGATPSGTAGTSEEFYRLIGHFTWNGTAITDIRQVVGGAALPKHASSHNPGGSDALNWSAIAATIILPPGTLASRPAAAAGNTGYVYVATDVNGGTPYRSNGTTWAQIAKGVTEAGAVVKFSTNVGDGSSTQIDVTHSLGTRDVVVMVREVASPWSAVLPEIQMLDTNTVRLIFALAPASGQYRITVVA